MSRVIVLIPHYSNYEELVKSILSIDEEINIDVLVVDDGSAVPPKKEELGKAYGQRGKVFLEVLENNQGIEQALNRGLKIIAKQEYEYIGRLDCGDLNHKNKYTKQINYLDTNKDVFLLGTWAKMVDERGDFLYNLKHPIAYKEIKKRMFLNNMFIHPTVVFRKEVIEKIGYYPTNYKSAEDFAYFFNIVKRLKSENYPEILLDYVIDATSISALKRKRQVKNRIKITLKHFRFGFYPIYGLLRNLILLFVSRDASTKLKKRIFK